MRLSNCFLPTLKETPREAEIVSHRLMLRAGLVRQTSAGIYAWLPLGLKVLQKISQIVREEQNRFGAVEMLMPTIQSADLWKQSGRYEDYGQEMLRLKDRHKRDMLYGPTNEEMITVLLREGVKSYKDLPRLLYHIQWKFRDEIRPRFGVMRGREFLMKDCYSFDLDAESARHSYNRMFCAYLTTFARMGLKAVPVQADTGPIGGDMSHEFHILADTGESQLYVDPKLIETERIIPDPNGDIDGFVNDITQYYATADEKHDPASCPIPEDKLFTKRGIEVGHIFYFDDKYSKVMNLCAVTKDGVKVPVKMGSYGIGVSRLVGAIIESCHDDHGIVWPKSVSPFDVGLLNLKTGDSLCDAACENALSALESAGLDVLYDDRDARAGAKFSDMDLIGLPWQIVAGPRGLANNLFELKCRRTGAREEMPLDTLIERIRS